MDTDTDTDSGKILSTISRREHHLLASYATHSDATAGRVHPEPPHAYRGPYQRDRDRILHSSAFRRLSGKTQVFTELSDYHRTRLTHTMEVASIARTIGRALRLNEDLIEALALLHDIGHPPFGHAGEDALDEFLTDEGGFSHNRYALTLVEELERPYPGFVGINLSREILDGQKARIDKQDTSRWSLLEVQVVDLSDSITYDAHDMDDGVQLGWLRLDELLQLPLVRKCHEAVVDQFGRVSGRALRQALVHELINCQVQDLLTEATATLRPLSDATVGQVRTADIWLRPSAKMASEKRELEVFLYQRLYRHAALVRARSEAQRKLRAMAAIYCQEFEQLPAFFRERCRTTSVKRSVADYVAGMTDHFCLREFNRLAGTP